MAFTLPTFVADAALTPKLRMSAFVADASLSQSNMQMPVFVTDPTLSGGMRLPQFLAPPPVYGLVVSAPPPLLDSGTNDAALAAPLPAVAGTLGEPYFDFAVAAPVPTLVAVLSGPNIATIEVTAPPPTVAAYMSAAATAALSLPPPTLTSDLLSGAVFSFNNTAPLPTIEIGTADIVLAARAPQLSASVLSGTIITVVATAPPPVFDATLLNPAIITAANSAAMPQLAAAMATGNILAAALAARVPRLDAQILTGEVATAALTAATPIMSAAGYPAYIITFAGAAPAPYLEATLGATLAENYRTWVLNTRKMALSEYGGFEFNSYTVFQGKIIAAGPTGVVELGVQDTDNAAPINATITTGQDSFGSSVHKRVPRIYTSGTMTGDMRFSTITTEGGARVYELPYNGVTGVQQRRIGVGKGAKSRMWQFTIANVNGSDFDLNDVLVYPVNLRRRVM